MPGLMQVMWVHLEEPDPDVQVRDPTGTRIWFRTPLRDASGATSVGIPQSIALDLAPQCSTMDQFLKLHESGDLNLPLLCHVRIIRACKAKEVPGGSSQSTTFVNHTVASVEPCVWSTEAAPNASYKDVLSVLNHCPAHDEGIAFAFLEDICTDPFYGFTIRYDGKSQGPLCTYVAVLLSSEEKSETSKVGEEGYKVVTTGVKDAANPGEDGAEPESHTVLGYSSVNNLGGFRLDPPRGKKERCVLAFLNKKDEEGFHIHKLEIVEPDQIKDAVLCVRKLRSLCKQLRPDVQEKRSHAVAMKDNWGCTENIKKARHLKQVPTDGSLGTCEAAGNKTSDGAFDQA